MKIPAKKHTVNVTKKFVKVITKKVHCKKEIFCLFSRFAITTFFSFVKSN